MSGKNEDRAQDRKARLGAALRENLKRRKSQAKGQIRSGADKPIVTPDDDAATETERPHRDILPKA